MCDANVNPALLCDDVYTGGYKEPPFVIVQLALRFLMLKKRPDVTRAPLRRFCEGARVSAVQWVNNRWTPGTLIEFDLIKNYAKIQFDSGHVYDDVPLSEVHLGNGLLNYNTLIHILSKDDYSDFSYRFSEPLPELKSLRNKDEWVQEVLSKMQLLPAAYANCGNMLAFSEAHPAPLPQEVDEPLLQEVDEEPVVEADDAGVLQTAAGMLAFAAGTLVTTGKFCVTHSPQYLLGKAAWNLGKAGFGLCLRPIDVQAPVA